MKSHEIQISSVHKGHLFLDTLSLILPLGHGESTQGAWPEKPKTFRIWPSVEKFWSTPVLEFCKSCFPRRGEWGSSHPGQEAAGKIRILLPPPTRRTARPHFFSSLPASNPSHVAPSGVFEASAHFQSRKDPTVDPEGPGSLPSSRRCYAAPILAWEIHSQNRERAR